jgi:hypothetical protein
VAVVFDYLLREQNCDREVFIIIIVLKLYCAIKEKRTNLKQGVLFNQGNAPTQELYFCGCYS